MDDNLIPWIIEELERRGWSMRELARRSGLSQTHVSNVLNGVRNITFDFCAAIARPLGRHPVELFELAGLLPTKNKLKEAKVVYGESLPAQEEIDRIIALLPADRQAELLTFARFLLQQDRAENELAPLIERAEQLSYDERRRLVQMGVALRGVTSAGNQPPKNRAADNQPGPAEPQSEERPAPANGDTE